MRVAWLVLLACGSPASAPPPPPPDSHHVHVRVDKRVELVAIAQHVAGDPAYQRGASRAYLDDVDHQFARALDHPAVRAARLEHALCLDDHLTSHCKQATPDYRAFAAATDFDAFYAGHAHFYADVADRIATTSAADKRAAWFDALLGKQPAFAIVPGLVAPTTPLRADHVLVLAVDQVDTTGLPVVGAGAIAAIAHELAHAYIDPAVARHTAELSPAGETLLRIAARPLHRAGIDTAADAIAESLVRAALVLYAREHDGAVAAATQLREHVRRGFAWTPELADALARARKRADLDASMPALAAVLAQLADRDAHGLPAHPFDGPIDAALDADPGAAIRGTPADPEIAALLARTRWVVTDREIALGGRRWQGADLVLVACFPRADDPTRGLVAQIAARPTVHVDAPTDTDWVVVRVRADGGVDLVARGDFAHADGGVWRLPN